MENSYSTVSIKSINEKELAEQRIAELKAAQERLACIENEIKKWPIWKQNFGSLNRDVYAE